VSTELITATVWQRLSKTARTSRRPAYVATAYFGKGASTLLPLPSGSRLVVNASEAAVKSGQTHPEDLQRMMRKGVAVYSVENLHAKVYVLGKAAFIGSANASRHSERIFVEAMLRTTDPRALNAAREFVQSLCLHQLTPETIRRLQKLYRPPRLPGGGPRRPKPKGTRELAALPRLLLAQLEAGDPPEGSEDAEKAGGEVARTKQTHPRSYVLDHFWWAGSCPYRVGDLVIQVTDEGTKKVLVSPPGNVVHRRAWRGRGKRVVFVYVECPARRRIDLAHLAKRLGRGARKRLLRQGRVRNEAFARALLEAWSA
jgi:hypothetical protein